MQAYYEVEVHIPQNHQLNLSVPDSIPAGLAKITVIYELSETIENKPQLMADFLHSLPDITDTNSL